MHTLTKRMMAADGQTPIIHPSRRGSLALATAAGLALWTSAIAATPKSAGGSPILFAIDGVGQGRFRDVQLMPGTSKDHLCATVRGSDGDVKPLLKWMASNRSVGALASKPDATISLTAEGGSVLKARYHLSHIQVPDFRSFQTRAAAPWPLNAWRWSAMRFTRSTDGTEGGPAPALLWGLVDQPAGGCELEGRLTGSRAMIQTPSGAPSVQVGFERLKKQGRRLVRLHLGVILQPGNR